MKSCQIFMDSNQLLGPRLKLVLNKISRCDNSLAAINIIFINVG